MRHAVHLFQCGAQGERGAFSVLHGPGGVLQEVHGDLPHQVGDPHSTWLRAGPDWSIEWPPEAQMIASRPPEGTRGAGGRAGARDPG